ncbi:STAS domain-containing protein [Chondromyces crocatus]|uniref:STAS domain-containing protein n=1 Tax=Chondromyces crocatus TaxID=52 RepID=A0A0K1EPN2_CHOCO|nr:STAS domain-containing protein [Chondromyces crocatus]AKT42602.1 uncharacterized protein CMC5_068290 [Chondromyces crocatus]
MQHEDAAQGTIDALKREIDALQRRVAELEIPARRYQALCAADLLSVQIFAPDGRTLEVNRGWEHLWRLRLEDVRAYNIRQDPALATRGVAPFVERAFGQGEPVRLPAIRYDPLDTGILHEGATRWVTTTIHPILDEAGGIREVVLIHADIGELKQSEEELLQQQKLLEAAVEERTAELSQKLAVIHEQQRAIAALSTPVLRIWDGVLALPLIDRIDAERAARVLDVLLHAIVETSAEFVIIDVSGVPFVDAEVAGYLRNAVRAAGLLGSRCIIVGISAEMARALVAHDLGFEGVPTFARLQEGLRLAMAHERRAMR